MISFIIPLQKSDKLIVERINVAFQFAQQYKGPCEIIALSDGAEDQKCQLARLALKINKMNKPTIKTAMLQHTNSLGLKETIKTGLTRVMGEKIIVLIDPTHKNGLTNMELKGIFEGVEIAESLDAIKNLNKQFN